MACLDTSFIVDLIRGKKEVFSLKNELDNTESSLSITAPTVMELWVGLELAKNSASEKTKINELIQSLEVLPLDEPCAKEAAEIEAELIKRGIQIEAEDCMIAGIARFHGKKIITSDAHFTRISNLKVLKY